MHTPNRDMAPAWHSAHLCLRLLVSLVLVLQRHKRPSVSFNFPKCTNAPRITSMIHASPDFTDPTPQSTPTKFFENREQILGAIRNPGTLDHSPPTEPVSLSLHDANLRKSNSFCSLLLAGGLQRFIRPSDDLRVDIVGMG